MFALRAFLLISLVQFAGKALAYPEFIGYGYSSCLTCHWNAAGGGGLNDYGRALFAAEIAAKPFWNPKADDEALGAQSNFLGKTVSPYWLKPGAKFRRLYNETNPGSPRKSKKYYTMQTDLNVASFTSEDMNLGAIATAALVQDPTFAAPNRTVGNSEIMAREYYVRWQKSDNLWFYGGFMDKTYGIRHPDHTAFNRAALQTGQNDQVHGVTMHYTNEKWDVFVMPFLGNLHLAGDDQSKGVTSTFEWQYQEKVRYGASFKHESDKDLATTDLAGHLRVGAVQGHAIMYELGIKEAKATASDKTRGWYHFLELNYRLARGMNFQSIMQMEKNDFKQRVADNYRWGFGFLYFPMQRVELRLQAVDVRRNQNDSVGDDSWLAQAQLHLSL